MTTGVSHTLIRSRTAAARREERVDFVDEPPSSGWRAARAYLALLVAAIGVWRCVATPLIAEECYYWCYAKNLDWSYYDHPPLVAWGIALGTSIFGDTPFGVRAASLVMGLATVALGCRWLDDLRAGRRAVLTWMVLALGVPLISATQVMATPDSAVTFFHLLAAYLLQRATTTGRRSLWIAAGAASGCALLGKYTAVFLVPSFVLHLAFDRGARRRVRWVDLALAAASASIASAPVLVWNANHGWASFTFQSAGRYSAVEPSLARAFEFVASQLVLVSPALLWVAWSATRWALARARSGAPGFATLAAFGLPMPVFFAVNSTLVATKVHWATAGYAPLALLAAVWWAKRARREGPVQLRRLAGAGLAATLVLCLAAPGMRWLPQHGGTTWDPQCEIAAHALAHVDQLGAFEDEQVFLFTGSHRSSAELAWGQRERPATNRVSVLAGNVLGEPAKQFDFWRDPRELVGASAVYVLDKADQRTAWVDAASRCFASFEPVETFALVAAGRELRSVRIYVGRDYRGPAPTSGVREDPCASVARRP